MSDRPLVVMFIGVPGSGKTYFGTRLTEKLDAVRLNSDAMRLAIFGSLDKIEKVYHSKNRQRVNTYTFGALDYVTKQLLLGGKSVVYEAVQSKRRDRTNMEKLAKEADALPLLVWIKTAPETALQRGVDRAATEETRQFTPEKMKEVVEHFQRTLDPPQTDENLIEISGEVPFEEQYESFQKQLKKYI